MTRVLFVFIDGIGLCPPAADNPFSTDTWPSFRRMAGGHDWTASTPTISQPTHVFRPIDATLGLEGLPQSGTGQATLFTGINCAERAGRHFGPFPHSTSKAPLASKSIFHRVRALFDADDRNAGHEPVAFANAYPPRFFSHAEARGRWTVTTHACRAAEVRLRRQSDLEAGQALAADLTGDGWHEHLGIDIPRLTPSEAGQQLLSLSRDYALTLFEYYLTDKAGHGRGTRTPSSVLADLDAFFEAVLSDFRPREELLLITSDHGNLEDRSTKTHTRHPVPLVAYGRGARPFAQVDDLTGVVPAVLDVLSAPSTLAKHP